jgi:hypothetical protein
MHESACEKFWVGRDRKAAAYVVYRANFTHSTSDSAYALTSDGLSIARARCDYLAGRAAATIGKVN